MIMLVFEKFDQVWRTPAKFKSANMFFVRLLGFVCVFDLILYVPSKIFQLNRDGSSWVEPVLS